MYRSNHRNRGTSVASLVPKFTFVLIVQTCKWVGGPISQGRQSFLTGHIQLLHAHILTLRTAVVLRLDRLCGPAHRVLHPSALSPDEGASDKAQTGEVDPGAHRRVCVGFSLLQGAKHLLIHTIEQPEYCHFKLHSSEKRGVSCHIYIHTYIS